MKNILIKRNINCHFFSSVGVGTFCLFVFNIFFLFACSATNPPKTSAGHLKIENKFNGEIPQAIAKTPFLPPPESAPKQETYTVVVNDVPVKDLLFALARDAKLNIDIHPDIKGKVTLNAVNQTLPQILNRLAGHVDLRFRMDGPNLVISPDVPYVRTYEVDYINIVRSSKSEVSVAAEISTTGGSIENSGSGGGSQAGNKSKTTLVNVSENNFWKTLSENVRLLLKQSEQNKTNDNRVVVNPMGGIVSVLATEHEHTRIQTFLDKVLANIHRQVLIEVTIVEVRLNDRYQAGVDWQRLSANDGDGKNGPSFRSLMTDGNFDLSPVFSVTYNNADKNIFAAVKLLETFGNVKVLSSPKIMAINNQPALLKVVDETVYFTIEREFVDATTTSPSRESFTSEIHTIPVGLIMNVIPQITGDDIVTMNIRPTISRITGFKADPAPRLAGADFDNLIPEIQVREMESLLQVNSGQTVVLGGLMQNLKKEDKQGVPFLSALPVIGGLFSSRDDEFIKTELVIFLRPTVIHNGSLDGDFRNFRQYLPESKDFTKTSLLRQKNSVSNEIN